MKDLLFLRVTLKIIYGQKIVLNSNDKVLAYASVGTVDDWRCSTGSNENGIIRVRNQLNPAFLKEDFVGTGSLHSSL